MKLRTAIAAAFAVALSCVQAFGQATILPPGETCFQATAGINGMVGLLGSITGGSAYTNGTYGGVSLTGGSGSGATANVTVSGGIVTQVTILNPGIQYVVGDVLSAVAVNIGGTGSGFSVPVSSTSINSSLAGGTVGFFIPNTLTVKQTWQDAGQTTLNTNPVGLDQNGCAVIYGVGIYRQILKDSLGNTVWDKLTASASGGGSGIFWAGLAGGTGNAITITDSGFALQDGATIEFLAKAANTGPTTISVSAGTPIAIVNDTSIGPAALSGGEIGIGNTPMITYDAANVEFHLVNPAATTSSSGGSSSLVTPQGYLNLVGQASGDVIQTADVISTATIFYSPFVGNAVPIWNGSTFKSVIFSETTATLTAAGSAANAIQDSCVFSNNGVPTLVIGPAWTTSTIGAGNRGTGAGTAQLTRLQGIWVNAVSIIGYNGLSSYTIPANQCSYVGSILIDTVGGQVSAHRSIGQSRKFGIWNAYNRQPIAIQAQDPASSFVDGGAGWHATHNLSTNSLTTLTGLPEEIINSGYEQTVNDGGSAAFVVSASVAIGLNQSAGPSGNIATKLLSSNGGIVLGSDDFIRAVLYVPPGIGANTFFALTNNGLLGTPTGPPTLFGAGYMLLHADYRG